MNICICVFASYWLFLMSVVFDTVAIQAEKSSFLSTALCHHLDRKTVREWIKNKTDLMEERFLRSISRKETKKQRAASTN